MNINDFLSIMNQMPADELLRAVGELSSKVDLSSVEILANHEWSWD